ncbi:nuclear pore complex protein Nup153-like [Physella acuta]|uniref:nuclear pore complex protein Nup153-like n=1 Tax=Physella acuta TaxID=109671 RepID=UPI0027DACAF4|nr:nuclear pore complex protein Nup153-like [Physella acuta]
MATEGGGKIKSKRNQLPSKPYEKKPSLLGKLKSSVKDLFTPSWLRTPLNSSNTSAAQDQQVTQPQLVQSMISNDLVASQHSNNAQVGGGSRLSATEQPIRLDSNRASGSSSHGQMSSSYGEPCLENSSGAPPNVNIANLSQFGRNWLDKNESIGYSRSSSSSAVHCRKIDDPVRLRMSDSYLEETDQDEPVKIRPIMVSTGTPSRGVEASAAKRQKLWNPQEARHGKPFVAPVTDRPAFNSLLFGTPTKNDSSMFGGNFHESSFYSGKTRFGGAAAEKRKSLNSSLPYQSSLPLRKQVKATNLNSSFNATTSATAQRILETLDKMSTPLGDAKKMTQVDKSNDSVLSFTPSSYRRTSILGLGKPASRPLQIPQVGPPKYIHQSVSQAVIAKNRSKQSGSHDLGSTTENSLPISVEPSVSREKSENVPQLSTDTGKIKTKKFSQHIKSKAAEEEVEVPTLRTDFTLPISCINPALLTNTFASSVAATKSFDNSLPLKFTFSTPIEEKSRSGNSPVLTNIEKGFTFSSPIKASSQKINGAGAEEGSKSSPEPAVGASSGVAGTFSHSLSPWEPVKPKPKVASPDIGGTSSNFKTFKWNDDKNDSSAASDVASCGFTLAPAESLKTGSVMDVLGKDDFMAKFKKPAGTWECATCMIANKPDASKCVACDDASKPGAKPKQPEQISKTDDLMAKFKKAPGSWECDSCMLSNKPEAVKCVACDSTKPGSKPLSGNTNSSANSLSELFKKPPGNWECDTCMVQNSATALRCIACDSSKPGLQSAGIVSKPASNTTSSAVTISPAGGFVFNLPPTTTTTEGSGGFKFGNANTSISTISPSPATGFTFGKTLANKDTIATTTDCQNPVSTAANTGGFKFESLNSGIGSGSTGVPTGGFVFGNTSSKTQSLNGPGSITSVGVGFQFGASNKLQNKTDFVLTTVTDSSSPLSNGSSVANEPKSNVASQSAGFQFNSSANSALSSSEPATFTKFASNDNATKPLQPSFGSFLSSEGQSTTTTLPSAQKSTNALFQFGQTNSSLASTSVGLGMNKMDNKPTVNGLFGGFDSAPLKGITQGIGANDPSSAKKTVQFGSFSNDQSTNGLFTFGSTQQKAAPLSTAPSPAACGLGLFGSNSVMGGQTQGASFQFAAGPTPSVPAVNFAFKSGSDMSKPVLEHATPPQNKVIPSFSLTPNFNFGSTVQPANTPFQFGAKPVSSDNTSATTGFSFGASNAAPSVPMTANFNIGSSDPTRKIRKAVRKIKK